MLRDEIINEFAMSKTVGTLREFTFRDQVLWACLEIPFNIQNIAISLMKTMCLIECSIYARYSNLASSISISKVVLRIE